MWAAAFVVVAALGTEMLDVFSEGDSRASLGGLTTSEYAMHVAATIFKVASFAFMFGAKSTAAWSASSPILLGSHGWMGEMIALKLMSGSLAVGILHLVLLHPKAAAVNCQSVCDTVGCTRFECCTAQV